MVADGPPSVLAAVHPAVVARAPFPVTVLFLLPAELGGLVCPDVRDRYGSREPNQHRGEVGAHVCSCPSTLTDIPRPLEQEIHSAEFPCVYRTSDNEQQCDLLELRNQPREITRHE